MWRCSKCGNTKRLSANLIVDGDLEIQDHLGKELAEDSLWCECGGQVVKLSPEEEALQRNKEYEEDDWGKCPRCKHTWGVYSVGRDQWWGCARCKVKEYWGSNVLSEWRSMTQAEFYANDTLLATYEDISRKSIQVTAQRLAGGSPPFVL
jgi:ribosomal protein L37AE/L43A